jgi:hypothetical protein
LQIRQKSMRVAPPPLRRPQQFFSSVTRPARPGWLIEIEAVAAIWD